MLMTYPLQDIVIVYLAWKKNKQSDSQVLNQLVNVRVRLEWNGLAPLPFLSRLTHQVPHIRVYFFGT